MQEGCQGARPAFVAFGTDSCCAWVDMPPLGYCLCSKRLQLPVSPRPMGLAGLCWTPTNLGCSCIGKGVAKRLCLPV